MLEITRGDTFKFKFQRKDYKDDVILLKTQKIWFTVKDNYITKTIKLQKTLDNGIIFTDDGYYHVTLEPSDTKNLKYKKYVCDIQVQNDNVVTTIYKDKIKILNEVTFEGGE